MNLLTQIGEIQGLKSRCRAYYYNCRNNFQIGGGSNFFGIGAYADCRKYVAALYKNILLLRIAYAPMPS
jgi:hypothetical protein